MEGGGGGETNNKSLHATFMSINPKPTLNPSSKLSLLKQHSWSPDTQRDEAWNRRKGLHRSRNSRLSRSVTDEDLDELRGCIDLGFGFDAPSKRLTETLPALDLYFAVHGSDQSSSDGSSVGSPVSIIAPAGDGPELVKARLKQWAQVVACSVRQRS